MNKQPKRKDGGSAIPMSADRATGITIRDYFAAAALQGMAANSLQFVQRGEPGGAQMKSLRTPISEEEIATWCFMLADAMLAKRQDGAQ
jgi:hypothetical protein